MNIKNTVTEKQFLLKKPVVSIGQIYFQEDSFYMLAKFTSWPDKITVGLIELATGNLWTDPVIVENCTDITQKEWKKIQLSGKFELFNGTLEIETKYD